ncbi:hypothetical protein ACFPA8_21900 [Streptomyces ovatisporus]|uniref:Syndecan 1 n=1 Tax=Streptomyces ovatisporus TaxID=1128682 RepID=A0ABV9ADN6_9ACTN
MSPVPADTPPAAAPAVPAWSELPPLQRALGTPPGLVSDPVGFRGSLSAWQDTSFQRPLGHLVSPEAPSGLGHGLTSAFTVSRETEELSRPSESAPGSPEGGSAAPAPLQRTAESVSLTSARPLGTSLHELPRLTVAAPQPGATSTDVGTVDTSTPPAAPVQRTARPEASAQRAVAGTPPAAKRPRGFGLGEPLHSLPPTAQRTAVSDSSQSASRPDSSAGEGTSEPGPAVAEGFEEPSRPLLGDDPPTTVSRTDEGPQETAPSQPAVEQSAAPPVMHGPVPLQRAAADGTPLPRLPAPSPEPVVAPLVAQRSMPLFSGGEAASDSAPAATPDSAPPAVPVRWTAPDSPGTGRPHTTRPGDPVGSSSPVATAPVQRTAAAPPTASPAPTRLVTPAPPVQRTVTSAPPSTPAPPTAPLTASTTPVDAGSVAVAAGVAQRMADGSVVFRPPTVQRDTDAPAADTAADPPPPPDTPDEPVDPPPEPDPEPPPEPGADPADQPGPPDANGPQGAHSEKGGTPKVTDELVRALFAPLSRMLKAELRLDRERAGFLIDTRH